MGVLNHSETKTHHVDHGTMADICNRHGGQTVTNAHLTIPADLACNADVAASALVRALLVQQKT
eukprot:2856403-Amphidinium_carterae.1